MTAPIMALDERATNAELMVDCRDLGYIGGTVIDLTYGHGTFWNKWKPYALFATDIDRRKSPAGYSVDFTATRFDTAQFDTVVLDPPYKLNGTPTHAVDERYGVAGAYTNRHDRHELMCDGITEAARILRPGGHLLFKCQDQVAGGKVRWQTRIMADHAETVGLELVDMLFFPSYRPQPVGRRQVHARRNYSTLLIFRRNTCPPK